METTGTKLFNLKQHLMKITEKRTNNKLFNKKLVQQKFEDNHEPETFKLDFILSPI